MLHQVPPECDAHPEARAPVLPTTRSEASNTAYSAPYSAPYTAARYRLPYRHDGPSPSTFLLTLFLILTHNDGWQPQAHIPPPPMRCLAQTSRASQGRRNTVGAHPSPSPAAVSPSPLCAAPAHHHPLAAPSPRPPSRSVPVGQGKKKIRTFFPLSSPAPQLCSPTTPRIPPS